MTKTDLIGIPAIAHRAGVHPDTATRWIKRGLIAATKTGGRTSPYRTTTDVVDRAVGRKPKKR